MGLIRGAGDRELVQGTPVVMLSLFILGPLPQAIKMFGMKGLPWTKTWAVVFFAAWVGEVIVGFIAGIQSKASDNIPGRVPGGLSRRESRLHHNNLSSDSLHYFIRGLSPSR